MAAAISLAAWKECQTSYLLQVFYPGLSLILLPLLFYTRFPGLDGVCERKLGLVLTNAHCSDVICAKTRTTFSKATWRFAIIMTSSYKPLSIFTDYPEKTSSSRNLAFKIALEL
jgi:hypothetical protein